MNNYYNQTMKNLEEHLKNNAESFKKLPGSSSEGFIYEKDGVWFNTRVDKDLKFFILDAYKEIKLAHKAFIPAVSKYCQEACVRVGSLQLDVKHKEVYYHIESPFIDNAVTVSTFAACEEEAIKTLKKHYEPLVNLGHGRLFSTSPTEHDSVEKFVDFDKIKPTLDAIETHLSEKSNHNVVAKNISATSDRVFQCEIMTRKDRFRLDIIVTAAKDFMTFKAYNGTSGILIAEPHRYRAAKYSNDKSDEKKVGCIGIEPDTGKVYCKVNVSLLDGVIKSETVENCEQIVLSILHQHKDVLETISQGMPLIEEDDDDEKMPSIEDIFKTLSSGGVGFPFTRGPQEDSDDIDFDEVSEDELNALLSGDEELDALSALLSGDDAEAV